MFIFYMDSDKVLIANEKNKSKAAWTETVWGYCGASSRKTVS